MRSSYLELKKLAELKDKGILTDVELNAQKQHLLGAPSSDNSEILAYKEKVEQKWKATEEAKMGCARFIGVLIGCFLGYVCIHHGWTHLKENPVYYTAFILIGTIPTPICSLLIRQIFNYKPSLLLRFILFLFLALALDGFFSA